MRTLVSVQRIAEIAPIPGADAIEVAQVLGWHVVIKKGEFQIGDLAVYFEIDSLLPQRAEFDFLAKNGLKKTDVGGRFFEGYRLRTVKLRGQISQGLCLPVTILPAGIEPFEGLDVTAALGVVKYEKIVTASGFPKGDFPSYIPKTDETRIQSVPEILARHANTPVYVTEKLDGSSCTVFFEDGVLNVCSRSLNWLPTSENVFWKAVRDTRLEDNAAQLGSVALQGEVIGGTVRGNKLGVGTKLYFFSAYDFRSARYLGFNEFADLCASLHVETVPVLVPRMDMLPTVDEWIAFATRKSALNPRVWAEGVVVRSLTEIDETLLGGRLSFKAINPEFLLREE